MDVGLGILSTLLCPRPHRAEALSDDARLTSVCLMSVAYIGPKSPRKTKIGTELHHVTRDSDTAIKVKGQPAGSYCGGLPHSLLN